MTVVGQELPVASSKSVRSTPELRRAAKLRPLDRPALFFVPFIPGSVDEERGYEPHGT